MESKKQYIIDTNVLLEDPNALFKLRNGNENSVFIPYHVLLELDKFKKNSKLAHIVARVIRYLTENPDQYQILNSSDIAPVDYPIGLHWHHFNRPILPPIVSHQIVNSNKRIFGASLQQWSNIQFSFFKSHETQSAVNRNQVVILYSPRCLVHSHNKCSLARP